MKESEAGSLFQGTGSPTERETVAEAFLEDCISREGTQNQIWDFGREDNKGLVEMTVRTADGRQQAAGRLAPATLRTEGLRAGERGCSAERAMAVNWTDVARDNSMTLTRVLGQDRECCGDPSLMLRDFS